MLRGERVLLRAFRREDLEAYCRFRNDVEIALLADPLPPRPDLLPAKMRRASVSLKPICTPMRPGWR